MSFSNAESGQDFDLNLAPIIDCFTVLIAYLLVSASFVSIGFFEVGVAQSGEAAAAVAVPESLAVVLHDGERLELKLSGPETAVVPVGGLVELADGVRKIRSRWPALTEASVSGDAGVEYKELIRVIETLKRELPDVYVGD